MDTPLGFGRRNALYAMPAGLKLKTPVDALAADFGDDFFITAMLAFAGAHDLHTPAARFSVTAVHTEEIACEQRGFIAAGARTHFHERVTFIVRIFRQQQQLELLLQRFAFSLRFQQLVLRHIAHFRVA